MQFLNSLSCCVRLLMCIRKKRGPKTDPCDTPFVIVCSADLTDVFSLPMAVLIATNWILYVKQLSVQAQAYPLIPIFHSFCRRTLQFKHLNIFRKSSNTPDTFLFLSQPSKMNSIRSSSAVLLIYLDQSHADACPFKEFTICKFTAFSIIIY